MEMMGYIMKKMINEIITQEDIEVDKGLKLTGRDGKEKNITEFIKNIIRSKPKDDTEKTY